MKAFLNKYSTWMLCIAILLLALLIYIVQRAGTAGASEVTIYVDGQVQGNYSLFENNEILIETSGGTNLLVIEKGRAFVKEADCASQVCVHTQAITSDGGQIICLPHKVVIRADVTGQDEPDAITN